MARDEQWRSGFAAASAGELPELLWTEDYLQSAYDPSIAPEGMHLLSVFAQYVPYDLAGGWDARRDEVGALAIDSIGRLCHDFAASIADIEVMGPPDIERATGLTGGTSSEASACPNTRGTGVLPPGPRCGVCSCVVRGPTRGAA